MRASFIRLWQFACSACFFVLIHNSTVLKMTSRLKTATLEYIFFFMKLLFIYLFVVFNRLDRNKIHTGALNLINLMSVCLIVRSSFCFFFIDSITNEIHTMQSPAIERENRFLFRLVLCIFNISFRFLLQTRKKRCMFFC